MPNSIRYGEKGQRAEQSIDALCEAIETVENMAEYADEAAENIDVAVE